MNIQEAKKHPAYSDGYADGFLRAPMQAGQPEQYGLGYAAGDRAAEAFESIGFERTGDGLAISFSIGGDHG